MQLRCNCTEPAEFLVQADILTKIFVEKGYAIEALRMTLDQIAQMHRGDLLKEKSLQEKQVSSPLVPFIVTFSVQHKSIKQLICKHWHILGNDRVLNTFLPTKP